MDESGSALTAQEFQSAEGTADWRVIGRDALAWFAAPSHAAGAQLLRWVVGVAGGEGAQGLAPAAAAVPGADAAVPGTDAGAPGAGVDLTAGPALEVDVRAGGVRVRLPRPGSRFTAREVELARAISGAAADLGLVADPTGLQLVQVGVDAQDASALAPFWQQVLGYELVDDVVLRDPGRRLAAVWFQDQDAPRPLRNRLHLDAVTTQPVATATVDALPGLGGEVRHAHDFYATVADADGNEADVLPLQEGADRWPGPETEDWRLVFAAVASYPTHRTEQALDLVERVAALADEAGLPLGIDVRPGRVTLDTGKDRWEIEDGYEALAARCQAAARDLGLQADVAAPRFLQVGVDAVDVPAVRRFWAAALGYVEDPREGVTDLVDPHQLTMPLFLQSLDPDEHERRAQRNRIHLDVFVPDDQAQARVDTALAAGGRVTYDTEAPAWWTLADPEGNEVCIAVSPGREERWGE